MRADALGRTAFTAYGWCSTLPIEPMPAVAALRSLAGLLRGLGLASPLRCRQGLQCQKSFCYRLASGQSVINGSTSADCICDGLTESIANRCELADRSELDTQVGAWFQGGIVGISHANGFQFVPRPRCRSAESWFCIRRFAVTGRDQPPTPLCSHTPNIVTRSGPCDKCLSSAGTTDNRTFVNRQCPGPQPSSPLACNSGGCRCKPDMGSVRIEFTVGHETRCNRSVNPLSAPP